MERKGTDPNKIYLQPHTPSHQLLTAASAGADHGRAHHSVQQASQASVIASGRSEKSQKLTDSAYNSEHEHTPEQQQGQQAKLQKPTTIGARPVQAELWRSFNRVGNEMIVTKPGR